MAKRPKQNSENVCLTLQEILDDIYVYMQRRTVGDYHGSIQKTPTVLYTTLYPMYKYKSVGVILKFVGAIRKSVGDIHKTVGA
jgi:hypothetical protein